MKFFKTQEFDFLKKIKKKLIAEGWKEYELNSRKLLKNYSKIKKYWKKCLKKFKEADKE